MEIHSICTRNAQSNRELLGNGLIVTRELPSGSRMIRISEALAPGTSRTAAVANCYRGFRSVNHADLLSDSAPIGAGFEVSGIIHSRFARLVEADNAIK